MILHRNNVIFNVFNVV